MFASGRTAADIIAAKAREHIDDDTQIDRWWPRCWPASRAGRAVPFRQDDDVRILVGQVMKASKGHANPQMVNELLAKKLE